MISFEKFSAALPYDAFLEQFGSPADRQRWDATRGSITIDENQRKLLALFTRQTNVLVLAGAWCGDCASQCPMFERFAELAPMLNIRYLDRDVHADVQAELTINGGNRVPVAVFYSEDGFEVARYGERPLAKYRALVRSVVPELPETNSGTTTIVDDWLREFERVQWILRLSPRLRRLHND